MGKPNLIVGDISSNKDYELAVKLLKNIPENVAPEAHIFFAGSTIHIAMLQELVPKEHFTDINIVTVRDGKLISGSALLLQRGNFPYSRKITYLYYLPDFYQVYHRLINLSSLVPKTVYVLNANKNTTVPNICEKMLYPWEPLRIKGT